MQGKSHGGGSLMVGGVPMPQDRRPWLPKVIIQQIPPAAEQTTPTVQQTPYGGPKGIVRLVIGAAEVDDLGVDTPEGDQRGRGVVQGPPVSGG
jgi:hypothetical protein